MYRSLHHDANFNQQNIEGCMLLLQSWAWDCTTCPKIIEVGLGFPLVKKS